jgi:hypothetical protein
VEPMNLFTIISILLLGLLLATFMVLLPVAIIFNTRAGMKYRQTLAEQLERLRLGRMLTALGIDTESYLSSERVVAIREQMDRCNACVNTGECDTRLAEGAVDAGSISYCNNEASLQEIARQQKG